MNAPIVRAAAAALLLVVSTGLAQAQSKYKPPAPYAPQLVSVNCATAASALADTVRSLNPTGQSYTVRVSGSCAGPVDLNGFSSITLVSADPANRAVITRAPFVDANGDGFNDNDGLAVRIGATQGAVLDALALEGGVQLTAGSAADIYDTDINCPGEQRSCPFSGVAAIGRSAVRLYGARVGSNVTPWAVPGVLVQRDSAALLAFDGRVPTAVKDSTVTTTDGAYTLRLSQGSVLTWSVFDDTTPKFAPALRVYASEGSVYRGLGVQLATVLLFNSQAYAVSSATCYGRASSAMSNTVLNSTELCP